MLKNAGTDWTAKGALDKRTGKKPGDEGLIVKQASLEQYKKDLKLPGQKSFANDDAHGDLSLQLYDAPLAEEFAQRAQEKFVFQLSGKRFSIDPLPQSTAATNQLVLISRGLNILQIQQQLNNCLTHL